MQSVDDFYRATDKVIDGPKLTNFGEGQPVTGIAYTQNHALIAVDQGFFVYDKQPFHDFINHGTQVPEPSALMMGAAGLAMLAGYRNRREHETQQKDRGE